VSLDLAAFYKPCEWLETGLALKDALGVWPDYQVFDFWADGARARSLPVNVEISLAATVFRTFTFAVTGSYLLGGSVTVRNFEDLGHTYRTFETEIPVDPELHLGLEWEFAPSSFARGGLMVIQSVPNTTRDEKFQRVVPTLGLGFVFESFGLEFATRFDKRDWKMKEERWILITNPGYRYALGVMLLL
jgi:hypothetical protein